MIFTNELKLISVSEHEFMIFNYYRNRNRRKRGQREVRYGEGENVIWGGERR